MKLALVALLLALPVSASPKVCATLDVTNYKHDQFGDVDRARSWVDRERWCVRVADNRKTVSASMQDDPKREPKVYPDLPWNPKTKRWERWFPAVVMGDVLGRYIVIVEDKGDRFSFEISGEGPNGSTTVGVVPKR